MLEKNPYLNMRDAEQIYFFLNKNEKGLSAYKNDLKKIADRAKNGAFIFKDEGLMWEVIQRHCYDGLVGMRIRSFGELMQEID